MSPAAFARSKDISSFGVRSAGRGGALDLAEDALDREAEACWRAGDTAKARAAAEDYVAKYPNGVRLKAVKKFGGFFATPASRYPPSPASATPVSSPGHGTYDWIHSYLGAPWLGRVKVQVARTGAVGQKPK